MKTGRREGRESETETWEIRPFGGREENQPGRESFLRARATAAVLTFAVDVDFRFSLCATYITFHLAYVVNAKGCWKFLAFLVFCN